MPTVFSEFGAKALEALGAACTIPEILGQPELWEATEALLRKEGPRLQAFLDEASRHPARTVVLTGAGSSAYLGDLLQGTWAKALGREVRAVPTTDIVTDPGTALAPGGPTLLVSFARSGNSPESVATLASAEAVLPDVRHLVITCNPAGNLATCATRNPKCVLVLPPEADDRALAMTGSFTAMALAGLRLAAPASGSGALGGAGRELLAQGELLRKVGALDFRRAIFLGSGPLLAAARESHLKVQELSNGAVMCGYDSFLGFRHGPRAALDASTLLVFLFSGVPSIRRYEDDLVAELDRGEHGLFRLAVGGPCERSEGVLACAAPLTDPERAILAVLPAQVLGVYRSLALGLRPDNPSPRGAISRVVQGVTIHPLS